MRQDNYVYVDQDKVRALEHALYDLNYDSKDQWTVRDIAKWAGRALKEAKDLGVRTLADVYYGVPGADPEGPVSKLTRIVEEAPDTAHEINGRLAHLAKCDELRAEGFTIDPSLVFNDDSLPFQADIERLTKLIRDQGVGSVVAELNLSLYNSAEIDAAIASMSDEELQAMYIAPDYTLEISSWLFANVSATQMRRLHELVPALEPTFHDERELRSTDVDLANSDFSYTDVAQSTFSMAATFDKLSYDDGLAASIGAVALSNGDFLRENIQQNPNGSYTVTLYEDGEPVEVTVSNYLPNELKNPGSDPVPDPDANNWVRIYEKAVAQLYGDGSYEQITSGTPEDMLELITGKNSDDNVNMFGWKGDKPGLDEVEQMLDAGQPVVVGLEGSSGSPAYTVLEVKTQDNGDRIVRVARPSNPEWDHWITEDQYHDYNDYSQYYDAPAPG